MEENNTKEINLLQLIEVFYNWILKGLKLLLNFIGSLFQLSYKHRYIFIIVIIISLSVSQYFARKSARVYKAETLAMLYGTDAQAVKSISKQLENFSASNNQISLSTKLALPDSVTKNIEAINFYYVIAYKKDGIAVRVEYADVSPQKDTMLVKMNDRIDLQIKTRSIKQVPLVQAAILNYFNNNEVLKTQFNTQKNELLQQIHICNIENQRIDSLAKVTYFKDTNKQIRFDKENILLGEQKKQLFYEELLKLQNIKAGAEMRLANLTQPMVLPSGLVVDPLPLNGRLGYAFKSLLYGIFFALIISLLIDNLKKIITFLEKK